MNGRIFAWIIAFLLLALPVRAQQDLMQDTWVATDAVGRHMPTADEIGPRPEKRRFVGMFYVTWHNSAYNRIYSGLYDRDVTKILAAHPDARLRDDIYWPDGKDLPAYNYDSYHWGEPEYGYFISTDRFVIRHDISMLSDAGVDVLILGCTHYPLLTEVIAGIMGPDVALIDTGAEAAWELKRTLEEQDLLAAPRAGQAVFYASDRPEDFGTLASRFLRQDMPAVREVDIERY